MAFVLGVDIGTTSTIGILIELPSRVAGIAARPVTLRSPHPGWAEQDPEQWWANVGAICRELLAAEPGAFFGLAAIGVAGMVPALVLLDAAGDPLRPSIQQSDGRCGAEVAELAREMDPERFLALTGNGLNQQVVTAKLRWLQRHEPEVFTRIATVFGSYDFIAHRLCGELGTERNFALEAGFLDLATAEVSGELLALARLPGTALPKVRPCTEIAGRVTQEASAATGLPAGTPVIAGSADHVASAYATGIVAPGDVLLKFGGAGDILVATETARPDARLFMDYHVVPGRFMPNGCMATSGTMLNWLAGLLGANHSELDAAAVSLPPGADGLTMLPYLLGEKSPVQDPAARGVFAGLGLGHGAGHLWRAGLEAVAYGFAHHVEVFAELDIPVTRLFASDGGSRSDIWMQIAADVLGVPLQVASHPGSCLGVAWLAAIGAGLTDEWEGVAGLVTQGSRFAPNRQVAAAYAEGYGRYRSLYPIVRPWFAASAGGG